MNYIWNIQLRAKITTDPGTGCWSADPIMTQTMDRQVEIFKFLLAFIL